MGIPESIVIFSSISIIINSINRRSIITMSSIYLILMYLLKNYVSSGIGNLLVFISVAVLVKLHSKAKITQCFVVTSIILAIKMATEMMTIFCINFTGINLQYILEHSSLRILLCYISLIIMVIIMKLLKYKYFIHKLDTKRITEKSKTVQQMLLYLSILIMSMIGIGILLLYNHSEVNYDMEVIMRIFFVLALLLILVTLLFSVINYDKRKILNDLEKNLMEKNLKQMEDSIDALRVQKHDYMNHLQIILMQMSSGKIEEAKRYILGMAECDNNVSIDFLTGNHCIDAILNTKKFKASKNGIDLTACIDSLLANIELTDSEVSSILLNIIDNAIDELKTIEKDYKYVHVEIYEEDGYYNIFIKNNGSKIKDTEKIFEMAYSSKGENRGYGLYSIKKLLEEHNCKIDVESDDMETEFWIQIPIIIR